MSNAQRLLTLQADLNGKLAGGGDFMDTFRKHRGEQCTKAPDIACCFEWEVSRGAVIS